MKNILIIVDIQQGFINNKMTNVVVERVNNLIQLDIFDAIAVSKYRNNLNSFIEKLMGWDKLICEDEQQILVKEKNIPFFIVEKSKYSAVTPQLLEWLVQKETGKYPDDVFLVGVDTECCVLSTAIDLFEKGIRPIVLTHYCASSGGEEYHTSGIMSLHHLIGKNNIYSGEIIGNCSIESARKAADDISQNYNNSVSRETDIVSWLIENGKHISFAESCTGGLCSGRLINVSDASKVLDASFVTYANEAKVKYLKVKPETIAEYGVVSEQVAGEMARGVAAENDTEIGVGISGIAGPAGATTHKPVGMVCFGFYIDGKLYTFTEYFGDAGRNNVRRMSVDFVFDKLYQLFLNQ